MLTCTGRAGRMLMSLAIRPVCYNGSHHWLSWHKNTAAWMPTIFPVAFVNYCVHKWWLASAYVACGIDVCWWKHWGPGVSFVRATVARVTSKPTTALMILLENVQRQQYEGVELHIPIWLPIPIVMDGLHRAMAWAYLQGYHLILPLYANSCIQCY